MSKYELDLDYAMPKIDISKEELNEIIAEADGIIAENSTSPEKLKTAEMCLAVVRRNGRALEWVPKNLKTPEMCLEAVRQGEQAFECVPENMKTAQILFEMENHKLENSETEPCDDMEEFFKSFEEHFKDIMVNGPDSKFSIYRCMIE
jgi:hypothetical protein